MKANFGVLFGCALLAVANPGDGTADELFDRAVAPLIDNERVYAYTVSSNGSEGESVERFDPSLDDENQWRLLSVEGRDPTEKDLEKYRKRKQRQKERNDDRGLGEMIDRENVERISETDSLVTYRFKPEFFEGEPEKNEKFTGEIVVNKDAATLRSMEYYITETLKPAAVVKLEKLRMKIEFRIMPDGEPVPGRVTSHTRGRAMAFHKFDETETHLYSDYEKVKN